MNSSDLALEQIVTTSLKVYTEGRTRQRQSTRKSPSQFHQRIRISAPGCQAHQTSIVFHQWTHGRSFNQPWFGDGYHESSYVDKIPSTDDLHDQDCHARCWRPPYFTGWTLR